MDEKIFVAFDVDWKANIYRVYLVNPTDKYYKQVSTYTGAFCSDDDGVIETSRSADNKGELLPYSWLILEEDTTEQLDFVIWYWLDLYLKNEVIPMEKMCFNLPKYGYVAGYEDMLRYLPIIEKKCYWVNVTERENPLDINGAVIEDSREKKRGKYLIKSRETRDSNSFLRIE